MSDQIRPTNGGAAVHGLTAGFARTRYAGDDAPVIIHLGAEPFTGPWLDAYVHGDSAADRLREAVRIGEAIAAQGREHLARLDRSPAADDLAEVNAALDGTGDPDVDEMPPLEQLDALPHPAVALALTKGATQ